MKKDTEGILADIRAGALTYDEIAAKYGTSKACVFYAAKKHGVMRTSLGLRRPDRHPDEFTAGYLKTVLLYDPETGLFTWLKARSKDRVGTVAGWTDELGYVHIRIGRKRMYLAHRLAWFMTHGVWPTHYIDHKNGNPSDNRIANLRECMQAQNCQNTKTVHARSSIRKGVCFDPRRKKYRAYIVMNGRQTHIGRYASLDEALSARLEAESRLHGEFARKDAA